MFKFILLLMVLISVVFSNQDRDNNIMHSSISGTTAFSTFAISNFLNKDIPLKISVPLSLSVGMIPGVLKEVIDYHSGFEFSESDIGYDLLGVTISVGISVCVYKLSTYLHNKIEQDFLRSH